MKRCCFRWLVVFLTVLLLLPLQTVEACTGFIIGKNLTEDGSTLYGRTEDLEPNHNKNFVVRERKRNKSGETFVDQANGFTYVLPEISYQYTAVPDVTPEQGIFDEAGFNEYGVSMSATVSATANEKIQAVDPYVQDGLAESSIVSVVLPHVKTAKEGIELIAKIVQEQGASEGNIVTIADKSGVWYMEILSGHQYAAIKFPDDKFAVFPNAFFLGNVNFDDAENTIASENVVQVAKDAGTYKEENGAFHIAQSYNEPLADANRSRVWSGIKALDPNAAVNYDDEYFELLHSTDEKFTLRDAMNLQRNRLEGTEYKPEDQMELDGKGKPSSDSVDSVYKYPISNPNVMEAHIFQLKDSLPANTGGGVMWLSVGSPRNAPYLPYYGNIANTYAAYQESSSSYNADSWYWTVSRINDIIAAYPDLFVNQDVRSEMERLEAQWMQEQEFSDQEQIRLAESPQEASQKATEQSLNRAEQTFLRLKEIQKNIESRVTAVYGENAIKAIEQDEKTAEKETINLESFDYDFVIAGAMFISVLLLIGIRLFKGKSKGGQKDE